MKGSENININMRKNTAIMVLYQVSMYLIPLITMPYVARVLGAEGVGVYSYTSSVMSFCIVLTTMGVSLYGRREIAACLDRESRSKTFWSIFSIESIMFILTLFGYSIYVWLNDSDIKIAQWLQILALIGGWLDISWLFFGVENFKYAVIRNILVRVISLILIFAFIRQSSDVYLYVFIVTFSDLVSVIPLWSLSKKYINKCVPSKSEIKEHIIPMSKMLITALSTNLYTIIDKVIIGGFVSLVLVGVYDNAFRISKVTVAFITTIGVVMMPRMTKLFAEGDSKKSLDYFKKSLSLTLFLGAGCAFGLIGVAPTFIPLYLGEEFSEGIIVTQIISISLFFVAWGNVFRSQFILPRKKDNLYVKSVVYAVVLNLILNLILIPVLSIVGAAIAYVITEVMICMYQSYKVRESFNFGQLLKSNYIYIVSAFLMMFVVKMVNFVLSTNNVHPLLSLIAQIAVGTVFYCIAVMIMERLSGRKVITTEITNMISKIKR